MPEKGTVGETALFKEGKHQVNLGLQVPVTVTCPRDGGAVILHGVQLDFVFELIPTASWGVVLGLSNFGQHDVLFETEMLGDKNPAQLCHTLDNQRWRQNGIAGDVVVNDLFIERNVLGAMGVRATDKLGESINP